MNGVRGEGTARLGRTKASRFLSEESFHIDPYVHLLGSWGWQENNVIQRFVT